MMMSIWKGIQNMYFKHLNDTLEDTSSTFMSGISSKSSMTLQNFRSHWDKKTRLQIIKENINTFEAKIIESQTKLDKLKHEEINRLTKDTLKANSELAKYELSPIKIIKILFGQVFYEFEFRKKLK